MRTSLIVLFTGLIFFLIGIVCLVFPEKIQKYAIGIYTNGKGIAKVNPFIDWVKTKSYLITLRIIGLAGIFVFALALYVIFSEKF